MDISLLATGAVTVLSPYLKKTGEAFMGKIGESMYSLIGKFLGKEKEGKALEKMNNDGVVGPNERQQLQELIKQKLEKDPEFNRELMNALKLNTAKAVLIEENIRSIKKLETEIRELFVMLRDAGIGLEGNIKVQIATQSRKMERLESDLFELLNN